MQSWWVSETSLKTWKNLRHPNIFNIIVSYTLYYAKKFKYCIFLFLFPVVYYVFHLATEVVETITKTSILLLSNCKYNIYNWKVIFQHTVTLTSDQILHIHITWCHFDMLSKMYEHI